MDSYISYGDPGFTTVDAGETHFDETQGGIWGNYETEPQPSALAVALKNLIKAKQMAIMIYNWQCDLPQATGDGIGFPAGFGNWWRTQ